VLDGDLTDSFVRSDGRAVLYGAPGRRERRLALGKVADMPDMRAKSSIEPADSPLSHPPASPAATRTDAERQARHAARNERREARPEPPEGMIPSGRKRLPVEAPLMRVVATGGVVGIGVVIAAIMGSQDSQGWLIGLVVSVVSIVLSAVLWSSRRL
jgi:hypothetical protein